MNASAPKFKIAIPSHGRAATIRTPLLFPKGEDIKIIVHNDQEAAWYRKNGLFAPEKVLVTGCEPGIARQRNWILNNLVKTGEWVLMLDDNIAGVTSVVPSLYDQASLNVEDFNGKFWRDAFNHVLVWEVLKHRLEQDIALAEQMGVRLIGYATTDNFYFRSKKYREMSFVVTKMSLVKKSELRFDENLIAKDDLGFTCENLLRVGRVLVNSYIRPEGPHHEPGGIGNQEVRRAASARDAAYLVKKYPELVRINLARRPIGTEIALNFHTVDRLQKWREKYNTLQVAEKKI